MTPRVKSAVMSPATMEPGHPELLTYTLVPARLHLVRAWIIDGEPVRLGEAEFVRAGSPVAGKLKDPEFTRTELLERLPLDRAERHDALLLSRQPQKGWNHGEAVDRMLAQIARRRPDGMRDRILQWVLKRVPPEGFQKAKPGGVFSSWRYRDFPPGEDTLCDAVLVRSEWGEKLKPDIQVHVVRVTLPEA